MRDRKKFVCGVFKDCRLYSMFDSQNNPAKNEVGNVMCDREADDHKRQSLNG